MGRTCGLWVIYLQHTIEEGRKVIKELMSIYWHKATAKQPVEVTCQKHTGYFKEIYKYIQMVCKHEYTTLLSNQTAVLGPWNRVSAYDRW